MYLGPKINIFTVTRYIYLAENNIFLSFHYFVQLSVTLTYSVSTYKVMDKLMPRRRMRVKERVVPYMTAQWKEAIRNKRKYAKRNRKNP